MKKLKGKNLALYDRIDELEKNSVWNDDIFVSYPSHPSQDNITNCNTSQNLRDTNGTTSVPQVSQGQEPTPKQDPIPEPGPEEAELISGSLKYIAGINEDLTGWTLWKKVEQGKEYRFATDSTGAVRWERWYTQTAILSGGNSG